jgi:hypothetical protein
MSIEDNKGIDRRLYKKDDFYEDRNAHELSVRLAVVLF